MIDEGFKQIRRKFQGKYFKWERKYKGTSLVTCYYHIKKIIPSKYDKCLVLSDCIISYNNIVRFININFSDICKYKDRSFYSTFGKRIFPSLYKEKMMEYDRQRRDGKVKVYKSSD